MKVGLHSSQIDLIQSSVTNQAAVNSYFVLVPKSRTTKAIHCIHIFFHVYFLVEQDTDKIESMHIGKCMKALHIVSNKYTM